MKICEIKIKTSIDYKPPYFMGLQLRAAFANALKSVVCVNHTYKCEGCLAFLDCLYYSFYQSKNEYKKFRFDFELNQEKYDFALYLFDDVCDWLPYVASALQIMLCRNGLGKERVKHKEFKMLINGVECIQDGVVKLPENFTIEPKFDRASKDLLLKIVTPVRINKNNLDIFDILKSIKKRKDRIFDLNDDNKDYADIACKSELKFRWLNGKREDNVMKLGGYIGKMDISGVNQDVFGLLKLGEIIGVGKQTVFGLGKIRAESKNE